MKTRKVSISIMLIALVFVFTNCSNNASSIPGSLTLKASKIAKSSVIKAPSVLASGVTITSAKVQIQNLVIEENTGEGINGNNENNNDNNQSDGLDGLEGKDGGDVKLAGPYALDVFSDSALITNVSLQAGTYKKVYFNFSPGSGANHSIVIGGNYNNGSATIPFTIIADLSSSVQLPLSGTGLTIKSGISSSLSIVFDINLWIKNIDFSTAIVKDNAIIISTTDNKALYDLFVSALSTNIDVEKE